MSAKRPGVGLGIILENKAGEILVMKRQNSHAPFWSIPGGGLEFGESFELGAAREAMEELGITLRDPKVIAVTNNLETARAEGIHHISIILHSALFDGEPQNMEPHKCEELAWVDPHQLPQPHFEASRLAVQYFLDKTFYEPTTK